MRKHDYKVGEWVKLRYCYSSREMGNTFDVKPGGYYRIKSFPYSKSAILEGIEEDNGDAVVWTVAWFEPVDEFMQRMLSIETDGATESTGVH